MPSPMFFLGLLTGLLSPMAFVTVIPALYTGFGGENIPAKKASAFADFSFATTFF